MLTAHHMDSAGAPTLVLPLSGIDAVPHNVAYFGNHESWCPGLAAPASMQTIWACKSLAADALIGTSSQQYGCCSWRPGVAAVQWQTRGCITQAAADLAEREHRQAVLTAGELATTVQLVATDVELSAQTLCYWYSPCQRSPQLQVSIA